MSQGGKGGSYGVNPNQNAARGMQQAFNAVGQGVGQYQDFVNQGGGTYNPTMQAAPNNIQSGMATYQNPYENQVVQNTVNDMNRNLQMQQVNTAADASRAGAFGGSRHGIVEGINQAETNRAIGDMASRMRQQGFNTAGQFSASDISNQLGVQGANQNAANVAGRFNAGQTSGQMGNLLNAYMGGAQQLGSLAGQSFGMGNQIQQNQMQSGTMAQQLQQALMNQGQGLYNQWASQPQNILQMRLGSLGVNPLNNATTTTQQTNPGWGPTFGNLLGAAGNMFQFAPIALSSIEFKTAVNDTGEIAKSVSGKEVPVVTFKYRNSPITHKGVIAESLGADDPAVITKDGKPFAVDYSKLEVIQ